MYDENGRLLYYELENRLKEKTQFCYTITESGRQALAEGNKRAKAQMAALQLLADAGCELNAAEMEAAGVRTETLRTLMQKAGADAVSSAFYATAMLLKAAQSKVLT